MTRGGHPAAALACCLLILSSLGCAGERPALPAQLPPPEAERVELTLYLLGDGGDPGAGGDPVLEALSRRLADDRGQTIVALLGDNIYPDGMPVIEDPKRHEMERRLRVQVDAALAGADEVIVLPGNHDWEKGAEGGWQAILRQQEYVDSVFDRRVRWLPRDGCPGPEVVDVGERLRLVVLDTQWFLHPGPRPEGERSGCSSATSEEAMNRLKRALEKAGDRHVALLAHHPLRSGGRHGGYFPWRDHLFPLLHVEPWMWLPLPIIGSAYPLARSLGISSQDQSSEAYARLVEGLEGAFAEHPPLLAAAGHEHNLEVLGGDPRPWVLISGAGQIDETTPVSWPPDATYVAQEPGFMRLSFLHDSEVRLEVITVDEQGRATVALSISLAAGGSC